MLQSHHKHSIKQTLLAFTSMLIVGLGLFWVLKPNVFSMASAPSLINNNNNTGTVYNFPDTNLQPSTGNSNLNSKTNPINKYVVQPQNLPVYLVSSVIDGDTIILENDVRVKLAGIKAPSNDEDFGVEATDFLKGLVEGKEVYFQIDEKNPQDDFGRLNGIIYLDRKNINIEILRNGFAHIFTTTPSIVGYTDWKQFEDEARLARRGLWSGEKTNKK